MEYNDVNLCVTHIIKMYNKYCDFDSVLNDLQLISNKLDHDNMLKSAIIKYINKEDMSLSELYSLLDAIKYKLLSE